MGAMACTMMYCPADMRKPSKCEKFFPPTEQEKEEPPANCYTWFDGCNTCLRSFPGKPLSCTRRFCSIKKTAKCLRFFPKSPVLTKFPAPVAQKVEPPIDCKNWFDGCNSCRRSEPGGN